MTNTISPVTDNVYRLPGGYELQPQPITSELPAAGHTPATTEDTWPTAEQDAHDQEVAQALYADALALADTHAQPKTPEAAYTPQPTETAVVAEQVETPESYIAEATLRARALSNGLIDIREHAERVEQARSRGDYILAA